MQEEILNIEYHVKQLVLKALNRYKKISDAASALQISERHVWRLRKIYNIEKHYQTKEYYFKKDAVAAYFTPKQQNA